MKTYTESNILLEVRHIKEKLSEEAARIGPEKFYLSLNGTAAKLIARYRGKPRAVPPHRGATEKTKRRVTGPSSTPVLREKPVKYKAP